jgi:hypothetical protein
MKTFKRYISEKKIAHALDPNKSLKHAIKDRGVDWDNDGDVDDLDRKKVLPDEITATEKPDLTATARKKNAAELKHVKIGVAYEEVEQVDEAESWEAGYKRRVVKTSNPEHKEKGMNWRIKGKDRPEISIKLYKEKPSQAEFNKQMKRVAGHEFGG